MGETRVDLLHLLEDLADAYHGGLEETILTEIVANSLDSGASSIALHADPAARTLTVVDDGVGMRRADLRRFHDIAATSKTRGEGIGFAGVGIKLGLLACDEVVTETRRGKQHVATTWALVGRKRAPWQYIAPPGLVSVRGTAVRLRVRNALSPLVDPGFIESVLTREFEPLFDAYFHEVLREHYPRGIRFTLDARDVTRLAGDGTEQAPLSVRIGRKRKPSAYGYLVREPGPLPDERRGLGVSTFGKVIKRGWDWLGVSPATPQLIGGLVEVPPLAACLTLNKADFLRTGPRGATYLAYRKALQEAVSAQLALWGDAPRPNEDGRRRTTRPIERDMEQVLLDLSKRFPLLATLVEQRVSGSRRQVAGEGGGVDASMTGGLPLFVTPPDENGGAIAPAPEFESPASGEQPPDAPSPEGSGDSPPPDSAPPPEPPRAPDPSPAATLAGRKGGPRPSRLGLAIQFESRPGDPELGRLVESTVWVNEAHPAYHRAVASRAEGYHLALSVAMALAPMVAEARQEHAFVSAFLVEWGESRGTRAAKGKRRRR